MQRWVLLASISGFGFLNGLVNAVDAILSTMIALMGVSLQNYVYFTQVLGYLGPIMALPTAWFVDRYGIQGGCYSCIILVLTRNGARALFFLPQLDGWHALRYLYWLAAGISEKLIITIYYCLPLKLAEHWFSNENERSFAWCCMIVAPKLGATVISYIQPHFVSGIATVWPLAYLNLITMVFTCLSIFAALVVVAKPQASAGSASNERQSQVAEIDKRSLMQGLMSLFSNKFVMLHMIMLNVYNTLDNVIKQLMQDILAASGFSTVFCGHLLSALDGCTCLIMLGGSFLIKDTSGHKGNTWRCKLFVLIQWIAFNLYASSLILPALAESLLHGWLLVASSMVYTACRAWALPSLNNLMAYLVAGSTSPPTLSGGQTILDFFVSNFLTFTFVALRQVDLTTHQISYLHPVLFFIAIAAVFSLAYLIYFSGRKQKVHQSPPSMHADERQEQRNPACRGV